MKKYRTPNGFDGVIIYAQPERMQKPMPYFLSNDPALNGQDSKEVTAIKPNYGYRYAWCGETEETLIMHRHLTPIEEDFKTGERILVKQERDKDWYERIYIGSYFPNDQWLCVDGGGEEDFLTGKSFSVTPWKYAKKKPGFKPVIVDINKEDNVYARVDADVVHFVHMGYIDAISHETIEALYKAVQEVKSSK